MTAIESLGFVLLAFVAGAIAEIILHHLAHPTGGRRPGARTTTPPVQRPTRAGGRRLFPGRPIVRLMRLVRYAVRRRAPAPRALALYLAGRRAGARSAYRYRALVAARTQPGA